MEAGFAECAALREGRVAVRPPPSKGGSVGTGADAVDIRLLSKCRGRLMLWVIEDRARSGVGFSAGAGACPVAAGIGGGAITEEAGAGAAMGGEGRSHLVNSSFSQRSVHLPGTFTP